MVKEIRVPSLGESVTEATVGQWFKQAGDDVTADEPLVELETDKVTVEVPAPASGVLSEIVVKAGDTVAVGAMLGAITEGDGEARESKLNSGAETREAPKLAPVTSKVPPTRAETPNPRTSGHSPSGKSSPTASPSTWRRPFTTWELSTSTRKNTRRPSRC